MDQESCSVYKEIIVWGPDRCNKTWCRCISNMNSLGWNPTESQEWGRWRSCLSAVVVCGKLNKSCLALHNENTFIAWSLHNGSFSFSGILSTWSATICEAYSITWKHFCYPLRCSYVLWDDWGTTKPFKELCGSVVLLVNFGDKTMKLHSFCQGQGQGAAAPTTAKSH